MLSFKDTMLLSKVLHDVQFKEYFDNLNLDGIFEKNVEQKDKLLKLLSMSVTHIVTNMWRCNESLLTLIMNYKKIEEKEINIDTIYDTLNEIFKNGIPTQLQKLFKIDDIKKKLSRTGKQT